MFLNKILFFFFYLFLILTGKSFSTEISYKSENDYKYKFSFICKTYKPDIYKALNLYKSYEKFVINNQNYPFFMIVPEKDLKDIKSLFKNTKDKKEIKNLPTFLTEEEVLKNYRKDYKDKTDKIGGWKVQQIVKLTFFKMKLTENYMSIDSDIYFTKEFDVEKLLFKDGILKTAIGDYDYKDNYSNVIKKDRLFKHKHPSHADLLNKKEQSWFENVTKIKEVLEDKTTNYNQYVTNYALWNSQKLEAMDKFLNKKNYNLIDIILMSPWEMNWYAYYVINHHRNEYYPIGVLFTLITKDARCFPLNGYKEHYGICNQYSENIIYTKECNIVFEKVFEGLRKFKKFTRKVRKI